MRNRFKLFTVLLAVLALFTACSTTTEQAQPTDMPEVAETAAVAASTVAAPEVAVAADTLKAVLDRGVLKCGGNASVAGFGFLDPETNQFSGFDIDFCKAIAAAVLGDATKIEVKATTGTDRFPVLQSGEIDVLIRNTTWTSARDTSLGFDFAPVTFYDGQGMMVRADSGITSLEDLDGGTICVQAGTTTEKNLSDVFRALGLEFTPAVYPENPATTEAYKSGSCDAITTDKSGLASIRVNQLDDPENHIILDVTMSKEPLGPLTRHGDNNWNDIVSWTVYCTIQAEESGVTSANVDEMLKSEDPTIQTLLGVTGELGKAMGIPNDFCYQAIKQVGNYGEIYNRNLGPDTPLNLPRGLNELYTNGGLMYAIPFRQ